MPPTFRHQATKSKDIFKLLFFKGECVIPIFISIYNDVVGGYLAIVLIGFAYPNHVWLVESVYPDFRFIGFPREVVVKCLCGAKNGERIVLAAPAILVKCYRAFGVVVR